MKNVKFEDIKKYLDQNEKYPNHFYPKEELTIECDSLEIEEFMILKTEYGKCIRICSAENGGWDVGLDEEFECEITKVVTEILL